MLMVSMVPSVPRWSLSFERLFTPESMSSFDYIKLDQFLKQVQIAASGGQAKVMVQGGEVQVNGEVEVRRGRKLVNGDRVEVAGQQFTVDLQALI